MKTRELWSRLFVTVGYAAMLVGALDPMEGALAILPGSALATVGTFLDPGQRRWRRHRILALGLIAFGVAALFGTSAVGGMGGTSGHSMWWALLILPYPVGWGMAIIGPAAPRWAQWGGVAIGGCYTAIAAFVVMRPGTRPGIVPHMIILGIVGLVLIASLWWRVRGRRPENPSA